MAVDQLPQSQEPGVSLRTGWSAQRLHLPNLSSIPHSFHYMQLLFSSEAHFFTDCFYLKTLVTSSALFGEIWIIAWKSLCFYLILRVWGDLLQKPRMDKANTFLLTTIWMGASSRWERLALNAICQAAFCWKTYPSVRINMYIIKRHRSGGASTALYSSRVGWIQSLHLGDWGFLLSHVLVKFRHHKYVVTF